VPGGSSSNAQLKLSSSTVASAISSTVSQIANRSVISSPGCTVIAVCNHPVAPRPSNPVPLSSSMPNGQLNFLPLYVPGSHASSNALLTEMGLFAESNEMLLFGPEPA